MMPEDFPGECPAGAAVLVSKVRSALNVRFQGTTPPRVLFVDRGKGFYNPGHGKITPEFQATLAECRFKDFWGDDASVQPGHMQEVMLHETAVSWLRKRLTLTTPANVWEETPAQYAARLRRCCADINSTLDVAGLCRDFPKRIQTLLDKKGGRLKE